MAHVPRPAYSPEELAQLYPPELRLKHVQIILRHGERTPVKMRFQNAGVPAYWPYCSVARQMRSIVMDSKDGKTFDSLEWRRRLETFDKDDAPTMSTGPKGEVDAVCNLGELTDRGRETTLALGERLRHLYVEQLKFMPSILSDPSILYVRSTPIPRALESVQQALQGLYPRAARTTTMPAPVIVTRNWADETLCPSEGACQRFAQLSRAFAKRAADVWNPSPEMDFLNKKLGKWMPPGTPRVAVDGRPRLSGIMDSTNATVAHGPEVRLPNEFYEDKVRQTIDKIVVEEWFAGYQESREYRMLGIGALVRDLTVRMIESTEAQTETAGDPPQVKFCLSGAHDTTLAALATSLGDDKHGWPPFTSHIAFEVFERRNAEAPSPPPAQNASSWWSSFAFFGAAKASSQQLSRKRYPEMTADERSRLADYYVRVRFNDRPLTVPGCRPHGRHLEGDESFCTLAAFKDICDRFAPGDWKAQCRENLDQPALPREVEPAGY